MKINEKYFNGEFVDDMENLKKALMKMEGKFTRNIPEGFQFANQLHKAEECRVNAVDQWTMLKNNIESTMYKLKNAEASASAMVLSAGASNAYAKKNKKESIFARAYNKKKKQLNSFISYVLSKKKASSKKVSKGDDDIKTLATKIMNQELSAEEKKLYGISGSSNYWCQDDDVKNSGISGMYKNKDNIYNVYTQGQNKLWADIPYSERNYEKSACGATSLAIIASNVDPDVTPIDVGQTIYKNADKEFGTNVYDGSVTSFQALKDTLDDYNISYKESYSYTDKEINEHLEKGQPIIVCVKDNCIGDGEFRKGHFVTLLGKNEEGQIFLGDPADDGSNSGYYDPDKILPAAKDWALFIDYDD